MHARTSSLQKYIDAFGEEAVKAAIKSCGRKSKKSKLIGITNPIMRFIVNTSYEAQSHLYSKQKSKASLEDYGYFKLTASILDKIREEITKNPDYKTEVQRDILGQHDGPMVSAFNEILVAAYYKSLGFKTTLNSSKQKGLADIDLIGLPFATDAKTFPNSRLRIEAIVNESAGELIRIAQEFNNQGLLISLFKFDNREVHDSFKKMAEAFEADPDLGDFDDETLSANVWDNNYKAADFHYTFQPNNVNIYFQASWDMGPAIIELKDSLLKADTQSKALGKQSIPWVYIPRDASRYGIEATALRFEGKIHGFVMDKENIFAVPVYGLEFEGNKLKTTFDIFETGQNSLKINSVTFNAFIKEMFNRVEVYV